MHDTTAVVSGYMSGYEICGDCGDWEDVDWNVRIMVSNGSEQVLVINYHSQVLRFHLVYTMMMRPSRRFAQLCRHARRGNAWSFNTAGLMKPQKVTAPMMTQMMLVM